MEELERLRGVIPRKPQAIGTTQIIAKCNNNAEEVLKKCKEILTIVLENSTKDTWLSLEEWRKLLPEWFLSKCEKETSSEEDEKWLAWWKTLPLEQQILVEEEKKWSLSEWIGWFEPDERQWFWWKSEILDQNNLLIEIHVTGWPFVWGSLKWLLLASDATEIQMLD